MNSLFVISETFTNGYKAEILAIISLVSILCGILVIVSKNPIVSVLFLIGLFLSISNYLIILGLNFIGLSYLLVYVGSVSILFLFILMLINVRISELQSNTSNSLLLSIIITVCFNYVLFQILPYNIAILSYLDNYTNKTLYNINLNESHVNYLNDLSNQYLAFVTSKI